MFISLFFWPSPAVALIGAVLLPVGIRAGLPALGVAIAMNLFGHGIALSGDFIIQAAPKLTADAAGIPVDDVITASIPLVLTMGLVTTITAYFILMRESKLKKTFPTVAIASPVQEIDEKLLSPTSKKILAIMIPIIILGDVVIMSTLNL